MQDTAYCYVYFAFDIGQLIDLNKAATVSDVDLSRKQVQPRKGVTSYFGYDPPPLVFKREINVSFGECDLKIIDTVQITLWDFGSISIAYTLSLPEQPTYQQLIDASIFLYDDEILPEHARQLALQVIREYENCITQPVLNEVYEDYFVFHMPSKDAHRDIVELIARQPLQLAQLLRSEREIFSSEIVDDSLALRTSYTTDDLAIIDWNGALVCGTDDEDILKVLEFAQVQLLEMRSLDKRLDTRLEEAYRSFSSKNAPVGIEFKKLAALVVDSASSFEAVNSALYLVGDQFLARVYQLCLSRFELEQLSASVADKVQALDGIYEKLAERRRADRSELLEIIIIVLILAELIRSIIFH